MGAGVAPAAAGHSAAQEGLIEEINAAYGLLRRDPEAWSSLERERRGWDATLADGLPTGEEWTDEGEVIRRDLPGDPRA